MDFRELIMRTTRIALSFLLTVTAHAETYIASDGNDAWSGSLPAPNREKTDGPLASFEHARDVLRNAAHNASNAKKIVVRGGTYYLKTPTMLTPEDSGLAIVAYPGERPVLSGGRVINGWRKQGRFWTAKADWDFRLLRVGDEKQTLARTPNFEPAHPATGGWSFIEKDKDGAFGGAITHIYSQSDWIEWKIKVPVDGGYQLWFYYAAQNQTWGPNNMAGRTTISVDGREPVVLQNLPDTGSWRTFKWSEVATIPMTAGAHTLRWTNVGGGGLNWDAFALSNDPDWQPAGIELKPVAENQRVVVVQAEAFSKAQTKEMLLDEIPPPAYTDHFHFRAEDIQSYPRSPRPEIHIFPASGWVNTILSVTKIDAAARTVWVNKNSSASEELRGGESLLPE